MKQEIIHSLTNDFESFAHKTDDGLEFWFARDLQHLLGYSKWENFSNVISKAKTACELSGHNIDDHFPDIRKMVSIGSGAEKPVDDMMLTRYACYLIAQNGDFRLTDPIEECSYIQKQKGPGKYKLKLRFRTWNYQTEIANKYRGRVIIDRNIGSLNYSRQVIEVEADSLKQEIEIDILD